MTKCLLAITLVLSFLLSACSVVKYEPYGYREGWRRARVLEIGLAKTAMQYADKDCRVDQGSDSHYRRYAVTSYKYGSSQRLEIKRVTAVPNDLQLNVGDWIYVNVTDCKIPLQRVDTRGKLL